MQALEAVPTLESAPLWVAAYEQAAALGSKCRRLNQCLLRQLTPMTTGPLRVSLGFNFQLVYMVMSLSSLWQHLEASAGIGSVLFALA